LDAVVPLARAVELGFDGPAHVMGILNLTPDSFSDGGRLHSAAHAVEEGLRMLEEGASILDIGGESTRPGAAPVTLDEELARTLPVIEGLRRHTQAPLSIDTTKAQVALAALGAGANILNDVSGMTLDPQMLEVAARSGAVVVLMHMRGTPQTMQRHAAYDDVVAEVARALEGLRDRAVAAGVAPSRVWLDPGLGFAKEADDNARLLGHTPALASLGCPLLVGPSRKRFLGALTQTPNPLDRDWATCAAVALAAFLGAQVVRVHAVLPAVHAVKVAHALRLADPTWPQNARGA
jgi:dihydropteroate synthase